jgi:ferredoxin-nitrite reductase
VLAVRLPTDRARLNQVERWKLDRHPFEVASAIRTSYAQAGPEAIAAVPGEVERLKWVGIYPQRQGGDAFMVRIKVPAGRLTAAQARRIGEVADRYAVGPEEHSLWGNRYCDLTTRQDVQMHWIRIGDVPTIWDLLDEVGITTVQACGDSARNVLSCPVSGIDHDEAIDASVTARAISEFFTGNREYANLPRKFKLSVTGCREDCAQAEINDIGMWPSRLPDGEVGFNLLVGGGLSDGPRMASDIDVFVAPDEAVEICRAVAHVFAELGNRENRGTARMRYLVQALGPEQFRAELAARTSLELRPAGEELTVRYRGDHVGVHAQHGRGLSYVGCSVTVGRLAGRDMIEVARLAETYGDGEVRLSTDQNFVLTGVPDDRVDDLLAEDLMQHHSPFPAPFERGAVACTGSEFCRFAIVETKARAVEWAHALDARYRDRLRHSQDAGDAGDDSGSGDNRGASLDGTDKTDDSDRHDTIVRLHFSGCPASCAQPQIADIGFRGETAHIGDEIVEAVDIGLGGSLGSDAAFGDWIAGAVPVGDVVGSVGGVIERYVAERRAGERFHEWARRTPAGELRSSLAAGAASNGGFHRFDKELES